MRDKNKMVDKFLIKHIGYTENVDMVFRGVMHYSDGSTETLYYVCNQGKMIQDWSPDCPKIHLEVKPK
jgi:hypothetical protein